MHHCCTGPSWRQICCCFWSPYYSHWFSHLCILSPSPCGKPGSMLWDIAANARILSGAGVTSESSGHGFICGSQTAAWASTYITQSEGIALGIDLPWDVSSLIPREVLQLLGVFVDSLAVGWAQSFIIHASFWSMTDLSWGILRKVKTPAGSTVLICVFYCLSCAQSGHRGC